MTEAAKQHGKCAAKAVIRPGYLRKEEAALYLNISIRTLTDWMKQRIVSYVKISHRVCLFKITDLDTSMDRYKIKAVGDE